MTEEAVRAELTALAKEVAASTARQEAWSKSHAAHLLQIDGSLKVTNQGLQEIGKEVAIIQGRCVAHGKRISDECERVNKLEDRLRQQEDTGVHHVGEQQGAEKTWKSVRKGFLFAFALLGALATVTGLVFGAIRLGG